ncbi:MAG: UDP-N-acetylmuramoyl-tripeptide--D-alanyl-D-alanine ligase [Bacteroidota bacterium]|nr:MAG: UDP-N-acetylmuramoyl-tripeptide--D-alanyl-D-alanine ligase [Bacteroidota bacterium]
MSIEEIYDLFISVNQRISTDTRNILSNSIFFALKGENFNGNAFAEDALLKGANYSIVDEISYKTSENIILVEDVLKCLQDLALFHRKKLSIPIIGITGSNGKTTTKELIQIVLSKKYKTLSTKGNLNNHIGVPLTILSILPKDEIAIIEMGANHPNEIDFLCRIAQPTFGIITNIGKAHLEGFGNLEGVIKTKTELYRFLKEANGKVFINANDELLNTHAKELEKISYGTSSDAYCTGKIIEDFPFLKIEWQYNGASNITKTNLYGTYNFHNIMAAICIGLYFNLENTQINGALEEYIPNNNRSQIIEKNNHTIILDAYNANPSSMKEAIVSFGKLNTKNKLCVLGDMLELGNESISEHQHIIQLLQEVGLNNAILVGSIFGSINTRPYLHFKDYKEAGTYLSKQNDKYSILIKGSRGIKLENILEYL